MDIKQAIIDRLRATKRENIENIIDYMENKGFFTYHCHRHHHYLGGLAEHAWQTYQIALSLDRERCVKNPNAPELDEDSIAIASLLHDICDCSGMRDISGHGKRSAKLLKALEFKLTQEEFLAIRFHMSLKDKKSHPLYNEALNSQLRYVVHKADGISARLHKGYNEPFNKQDNLEHYLQNITKLDNKEIVYQVEDGWFLGIHSPYDGEIDPKWKDKIIGVKEYDTAELYGINDSIIGAIYVLGAGDKKGLFTLHHYHGMQGGAFFSPDKVPFMYSDIKVYCDWENWSSFEGDSSNWRSYGYVACKQDNGWKLVKVTQFPMPEYSVIGDGFSSAEEAMKSIGIEDSEKYLRDSRLDNDEPLIADMDYNVNDVETYKLNVGEKYPLPTTAYLQYLDEDGDPELFKHKYYDATIRYITPAGSYILELAISPALIADANFDIMTGKEINEQFPEANLDNDKEYCVIGFEDSPIF